VANHGLPTPKHEDWRYTRLGPVLEEPFAPAERVPGSCLPEQAPTALAKDLGGTRLVFLNGHLASSLSSTGGLPEGARVASLASALSSDPGKLRPLWSPPATGYRHAFRALNDALATDGAFIFLPPGLAVEAPIVLVFVAAGGGAPLSSPRSVVLAGPGSSATVVEVYAGTAGGRSMTNAVTQVVLGEEAAVAHYEFQHEDEAAVHFSSLEVRQGRASRFSSLLVAVGARLGRHEVQVRLEEREATVELDGLYLPRGAQHHDNPVLVDHDAPGCASHQLYKGIVADAASGVFNGHVIVRPGAFGTDAHQVNKNLLLSEQAEAYTRPRLEIFADDVACTHGAAVGHLDEAALFYLRSLGIPWRWPARCLSGVSPMMSWSASRPGPCESTPRAWCQAGWGRATARCSRQGLLPLQAPL
jgi:Fe-S cluster assembly protein SufD